MTSPKSPGLATESVSGFSGRKKTKNPETDWDDKPAKPVVVIPICFGIFWLKKGPKNPKPTGMTRFGVFWPKGAKNPKTDWDDNPGKPIPVCFGVFWPKRAKKP